MRGRRVVMEFFEMVNRSGRGHQFPFRDLDLAGGASFTWIAMTYITDLPVVNCSDWRNRRLSDSA
jgi:hypothetical protein